MHLINAKYNRSDGFSAPDDGRSHAQIDDFCTENGGFRGKMDDVCTESGEFHG